MRSELERKAHQAAERFLARKGYEIIDPHPRSKDIDFVAKTDGGDIVFVTLDAELAGEAGASLPKEHLDREALERAAAEWLAGYELDDFAVRFDSIAMVILDGSRAFLRHHLDALRRE